jgi:hypothetical protein
MKEANPERHEAEPVGELFPDLPPASPPLRVCCTRDNYRKQVEQRWGGWSLQDALRNWHFFEEHKEALIGWLEHYRRDRWFSVGEKCHNSSGTLTGMVWLASKQLPGLIDFEEHFQACFPRRGVIAYLTLLLQEREEPERLKAEG